MTNGTQPTVFISGMAADSFSTLQGEVDRGGLFSERFSPEQTLVFDPQSRRLFSVTSQPGQIPVTDVFQFVLDSMSFPRNLLCMPGGPAFGATGTARVVAGQAQPARLVTRVTGLGPLPPGTVLNVWLVHDLVLPTDLDPADLSALPRATAGVNQPGQVFTLDGMPSTVGRADVPLWNTVAVVVRAGAMTVGADGVATLEVPVSDEVNLAVDPRVALGPQMAPTLQAQGMPSGIVTLILTDVFLRPATVLPQLPPANALAQRILTVTQSAVARFDRNGDGQITVADTVGVTGAFLRPADFNRLAITLDPALQAPLLLPNPQSVMLVGMPQAAS